MSHLGPPREVGVLGQPFAPEFQEDVLLELAQEQIGRRGELQTQRIRDITETRGLRGPQEARLLAQAGSSRNRALFDLALRARQARSEAISRERLIDEQRELAIAEQRRQQEAQQRGLVAQLLGGIAGPVVGAITGGIAGAPAGTLLQNLIRRLGGQGLLPGGEAQQPSSARAQAGRTQQPIGEAPLRTATQGGPQAGTLPPVGGTTEADILTAGQRFPEILLGSPGPPGEFLDESELMRFFLEQGLLLPPGPSLQGPLPALPGV